VAAALSMTYMAIGSDTGGSIRFPAARNALTGVKPTWGRISGYGIFDLAATFDHLGPMARSAADAAAMLQCLAGLDSEDPTSLSTPVPQLPC
jgi:amidase